MGEKDNQGVTELENGFGTGNERCKEIISASQTFNRSIVSVGTRNFLINFWGPTKIAKSHVK